MFDSQTVKMIAEENDCFVLEFADGKKIQWPKENLKFKKDEELKLVLTTKADLLNEILNAKDQDQETSQE